MEHMRLDTGAEGNVMIFYNGYTYWCLVGMDGNGGMGWLLLVIVDHSLIPSYAPVSIYGISMIGI